MTCRSARCSATPWRRSRRWPRKIYIALTASAVLALAALAVLLAYDRRVAVIYVGVAAGVFVLLRLVAGLLMFVARHAPRARSTVLRMAVANIHRPGALTPTIVLSLGLGIALLVTVIEIDGNLRRQFAAELPAKAPSFYFLDIPADQAGRFGEFRARAGAGGETGRSADAARAHRLRQRHPGRKHQAEATDAAWVLQSDRGITYAGDVPTGSRLVEGKWWGADYDGPPLLSFEKKIADGLGLKLGDPVTVNVLGRNITARIANMRTVDWESLGINFVMVFSPHAFDGAPHTHLATLTFPDGGTPAQEGAIVRAVADAFPMVTTVRVKDALDAIGAIVANLVLAIRGASALTLLAAALVLGGALAAGHRHRVYDAVILKTLGATRCRLLAAYTIEYLLLGAATAVFGVLSGSLAGWLIVTELMHLRVCLAAAAGAGRRVRRGGGDGGARARRHLQRAGPETGSGAEKSVDLRHAAFCRPSGILAYNAGTGSLTIRNDAGHHRAISGADARHTLDSSHERDGCRRRRPETGQERKLRCRTIDRNVAARGFGAARAAAIDVGLRAYMLRIYNYMAAGVALTGVVAWLTYNAAVVTDAAGRITGADAVRPGDLRRTADDRAVPRHARHRVLPELPHQQAAGRAPRSCCSWSMPACSG